MALWYGGLAQLLAGMWEFATGNTFGATGELFFHYHIQVMAVAANLPGPGRVRHVPYDVGEVRLLALLLRSVWHKTHFTPCRHGVCRNVSARHGPSLFVLFGRLADNLFFPLLSFHVLWRILALVCDHTHSRLWRHRGLRC